MMGCKKYTCECIAHNGYIPEMIGNSAYTVKGSKQKAKKYCDDKEKELLNTSNPSTCEIK